MKFICLTSIALLAGCASGGTRAEVATNPSSGMSFSSTACPNTSAELNRVDHLALRVQKLDMRSADLAAASLPSPTEQEGLLHDILRLDRELLELEKNQELDCAEALYRFESEVQEPFQEIQSRH